MKRKWRALITTYKLDHPSESAVKKDKFPQLLNILWNDLLLTSKENLSNGFEHCLSRKKIIEKHNFESVTAEVNSIVGQAVLDALKQRRFKGTVSTRKRSKEVCPAGASLTNMDSEPEVDSEMKNVKSMKVMRKNG